MEMLVVRHSLRQPVGALAAVMLQVVRQSIAQVPVDLPKSVPRIAPRKVVAPALCLSIQLRYETRDRSATLTAIRQLVDPIPLSLQRLLRRPHVQISLPAP